LSVLFAGFTVIPCVGITADSTVTAKAKAASHKFHSEQFALRDKVAAYLAKSSPADGLKVLVSTGVLTKKGKLKLVYRSKPVAA
jgi:hypothetical protein